MEQGIVRFFDENLWHYARMAPLHAIGERHCLPLGDGQITLFVDFFKCCNFRLPITRLRKEMLDKYAVHISQMHPLGLAKLCHFEYASPSLGFLPEKLMFRAF
ncbi:hypothetical protein Hanom_Chr03g00178711 [Helianthus anomalus]